MKPAGGTLKSAGGMSPKAEPSSSDGHSPSPILAPPPPPSPSSPEAGDGGGERTDGGRCV